MSFFCLFPRCTTIAGKALRCVVLQLPLEENPEFLEVSVQRVYNNFQLSVKGVRRNLGFSRSKHPEGEASHRPEKGTASNPSHVYPLENISGLYC